VAAIVYFEKTREDTEQVAYRYGPDEADLARRWRSGGSSRATAGRADGQSAVPGTPEP
jgi:hypothetical protein